MRDRALLRAKRMLWLFWKLTTILLMQLIPPAIGFHSLNKYHSSIPKWPGVFCSAILNGMVSAAVRCLIMGKMNAYLAFTAMLILAVSAANASVQDAKVPSPLVKQSSYLQQIEPYIRVNLVEMGQAAAGNSEPININVNIISQITRKHICGLDASNFIIGGPVQIASVRPISAIAINHPMTCDYWLSIVPTSPWVPGTHALKLYYIQGGQSLSNETLMFRI
jgi:hypothetical protein